MNWFSIGRWAMGALFRELGQAQAEATNAATARERIKAEVRVTEIRAEIEERREAARVRIATAGDPVTRLLVAVAGLPPALHFGAVCLDSALPDLFPGWTVHALPAPMNEWQGAIILSLFGLAGIKHATALFRRR